MILDTDRLILRELTLEDAPFILELVNEPSWLRFIGDRGVRDLDGARAYLQKGPLVMYASHGFGLYRVERKEDGTLMGMCGLIKREGLPHADIGFAFFPRFWGQGYAREAASAVLSHSRTKLGLEHVLAIVDPDNQSSIKLLETLGFRFQRMVRMPGATADIRLYELHQPQQGPQAS
ncbi:GNAT family N-acetyltransferase [Hyalangium rubrum]|uniref:GNAT family N-acetyltransferase n=1 Tax=Hyalangium rubrum TaxID=3103134 RepID=A0ABU5H3C6_9BACT|nr:GNAT family N-acetyltransferase [Hyalangium sp. s54d21]MDY7227604.1 GNAT family N-acetyltransferase [Hyalangium sp. s54d21]